MPTKTSKSPATLPAALIAKGVGGIIGGTKGGISAGLQAVKDIDKDEFKEMSFGEKLKTGGGVYGKAMQGVYSGTLNSLIGTDFGLGNIGKNDNGEIEAQRLLQEENQGISDAQEQLMNNQMGITKKGVIKKLGAITGTISPSMSMVQYKNENKFKSIAQKLEEDKIVDVLDSSTGKRTKLTKKGSSYYKAGQLVNLTKDQKEFNKPDLLPKNDKPTKTK